MKKFLALLLAAIMCFALAGCGGSGTASSSPISISSKNYLDANLVKNINTEFGKIYSNKEIRITEQNGNNQKSSNTELQVNITRIIEASSPDQFISTSSKALNASGFDQSSKYSKIIFSLDETSVTIMVNKNSNGELISTLTCAGSTNTIKDSFKSAYKKDSLFSKIDSSIASSSASSNSSNFKTSSEIMNELYQTICGNLIPGTTFKELNYKTVKFTLPLKEKASYDSVKKAYDSIVTMSKALKGTDILSTGKEIFIYSVEDQDSQPVFELNVDYSSGEPKATTNYINSNYADIIKQIVNG
jgi:tryptophan 2,3-dioxygenase